MSEPTGPARALPSHLPILPLRSTVLFPAGVIGLQVSTERSLRLAAAVDEAGEMIAIFGSQRDEDATPNGVEDFAPVGVAADVVQVLRLGPELQQIFLHGRRRVELESLDQTDPYYVGRVRAPEPGSQPPALELDLLLGKALAVFESLAAADHRYGQDAVELLRTNVDQGPECFADLFAGQLEVAVPVKQRLIEMLDPVGRLEYLIELAEEIIARRSLDHDVQSRVRSELDDKKREYFLREQMRVIRESLGEEQTPQREAERYAARVTELPLDEASQSYLLGECARLAVQSQQSAEYPMLHTYFETVLALPWVETTEDQLVLSKAERVLNRNHYGVSEVKERILEYLAVAKLKGDLAGPILCLVGPPGTGKTSLARSIAEALGRRFHRLSLGGVTDESEIRGHRKTYVGAMPGKILAAYLRAGSRNPVVLLDEVDKIGTGFRGDPASALLEVLDPEQNRAFQDRYLGVPFDLGDTLFIATANRLDTIPVPLRDRLEVLTLSGYTEAEKVVIARRHLLPAALADHGLEPGSVKLPRTALECLISTYTAEAGVRQLARALAALCRKVARQRASRGRRPKTVRLGAHHLERYLGPARFEHEVTEREPEVGVATGLAWTGAGGEILFIEAARMPGKGEIEVTGQLGEVMNESVRAAYSYVRSRARQLEIPSESLGKHDLHIHFPAGAIPKDGPSAGVAIATCIASLLSGRPVRHDVAMTGEITLRGKVLSVGGVKEKVLAAHRARVRTVILPEGNRKDLAEAPQEVLEALEVVFVRHIDEVWREALIPLLVVREQDLERYHDGEFDA